MSKIIIILIVIVLVALGAFFGIKHYKDIKTNMSTQLDFPTFLLSKDEMESKYLIMEHTLSPFPEYHFKLALEKDWKAIDTTLKNQISDDDITFHTVGLFQKRDDENNPLAEIEVAVAKIPMDKPPTSLKDIVAKQYGLRLVEIVNYRTVGQTGQDILFTFKNNKGELVADRMFSFKDQQGRVFAISGISSVDSYNQFAQNFYAAMVTFEPIVN